MEKMSEILESFLEPYTDTSYDRNMLQMAFSIGVMAWNISLQSEIFREN
jgi:hypothetical protein